MPLLKSFKNKDLSIYVWQLSEDSSWFSDLDLTQFSRTRLKSIKNEQHKRGFLSIRKLLNIAGYQDRDLYYLENGKPCLVDHRHISISHAHGFAAIVIGEVPVGIDLEKFRTQLFKIKHKFLNNNEVAWVSRKESLELLTVLWCCKESLYKIYPQQNLALKDISIKNFEMQSLVAEGEILKNEKTMHFKIYFEFIEDHVLSYAVGQNVH